MIEARQPLYVKAVAEQFQVSVRTIRYDLETIRLWLRRQKHQLVQLESKPNRGIWVEGDPAALEILAGVLQNDGKTVWRDHRDRVKYMALDLLHAAGFVTMDELAAKNDVGRTTVGGDLKEAERFLEPWQLALERKAHWGVRLKGAEIKRRLALEYIVKSSLSGEDITRILQSFTGSGTLPAGIVRTVGGLLPGCAEEDLDIIGEIAGRMVRSRQDPVTPLLSEQGYVGFLIRLCVMVQRVRSGHPLASADLKTAGEEGRNDPCAALRQACQELSGRLHIPLGEAEEAFLSWQWMDAGGKERSRTAANQPLPIAEITRKLIGEVGRETRIPFETDAELFGHVRAHLEDKLAKYWQGVMEPNPLSAEVIRSYGEMFRQVKQCCDRIFTGYGVFFSEADIAYLVLHFQAAYEGKFGGYKFRTLVVCSTGRGNARLLKTRLANEIKNLSIVGYCSVLELKKALQVQQVDLIVSVFPLEAEVPVVVINPILTERDIAAIQERLKEIPGGYTAIEPAESFSENDRGDAFDLLRSNISRYDLPFVEGLSQEVISRGFQLSMLVRDRFREYLTPEIADGLVLHILLMANRMAFGAPYVDFHYGNGDRAETEARRKLRRELVQLIEPYYRRVPDNEIDAILNYFSGGGSHEI